MQILFDNSFDCGYWPGPLQGGKTAAAGISWVGPKGLLGILETCLGLAGPPVSDAFRAASLVPAVQSTKGFWSESAKVDPLGTARKLLQWRDHLWMCGWRGEQVADRLRELAIVMKDVLPGLPDRLDEVNNALLERSTDIELIELFESPESFEHGWRVMFERLKVNGTRIEVIDLPTTTPKGDLLGACGRGFNACGDGSLQMIRPAGVLAAAEEVAAWLSAQDNLEDTVIIGGDAVLDAALHRFGLPTVGADAPIHNNALLQILPLVLSLEWSPPDPQKAFELLTLPVSPVPQDIAWRLLRALKEWPAVDSDLWRVAVKEGLEAIEDELHRRSVKERLDVLFTSRISRATPYPITEITRRIDMLQRWLHGRMEREAGEESKIPWQSAVIQCAALQELLASAGMTDGVSEPVLERFLKEANKAVPVYPAYKSEAGVTGVGAPGCVAGSTRRTIWWSFRRGSVETPFVLPLTQTERDALSKSGVSIPDAGEEAIRIAKRWRRPLLQTCETLLLVCPTRGEDGEEQYPHPLWDEIKAIGKGIDALVRTSVFRAPLPSRISRNTTPPPKARKSWSVPAGFVTPCSKESASSIETLLGCPFKYVVKYIGQVREKGMASLKVKKKHELIGLLAHKILTDLLVQSPASDPEGARAEALRRFDEEGPRLVASLFLPGQEDELASLRRITGESALHLFKFVKANRQQVKSVESTYYRKITGIEVEGRIDLVLGYPICIIDLKSGITNRYRDKLRAGTAVQLAVYSNLLRAPDEDRLPPVAYFMLGRQRMLALDSSAFPDAEIADGPDLSEAWSATERGFVAERQEIVDGSVCAHWERQKDHQVKKEEVIKEEGFIEDGRVYIPASCKFCDFGTLCGITYGRISDDEED